MTGDNFDAYQYVHEGVRYLKYHYCCTRLIFLFGTVGRVVAIQEKLSTIRGSRGWAEKVVDYILRKNCSWITPKTEVNGNYIHLPRISLRKGYFINKEICNFLTLESWIVIPVLEVLNQLKILTKINVINRPHNRC